MLVVLVLVFVRWLSQVCQCNYDIYWSHQGPLLPGTGSVCSADVRSYHHPHGNAQLLWHGHLGLVLCDCTGQSYE